MGIDVGGILLALLSGGAIVEVYRRIMPTKKEKVEARILSDDDTRKESTFWNEQFDSLEEKYKERGEELEMMGNKFRKLSELYNELLEMYENIKKSHNKSQRDMTYLRIELAAYKK